jgi:hypothetical protein
MIGSLFCLPLVVKQGITMFGKSFFKKLLCLPLLAAMLQGCSGCGSTWEGSTLEGLGFASDTTAILFYELWEKSSSENIPVSSSFANYYGWELMLVDVRFHHVYWKAQIDHSRNNNQILRCRQWNDSTMIIELRGEGIWLWTVSNNKPQKISFNWNTEKENYENGLLLNNSRLRPWKNDSILLFSSSKQAIIDSKTMIVNDWFQTDEDTWIIDCDDFWQVKSGGVCFINNSTYGFTLLSEKGDTLGNFTYVDEGITYYDSEFTAPNTLSYWIFGKRNFVNSLRNIMEY